MDGFYTQSKLVSFQIEPCPVYETHRKFANRPRKVDPKWRVLADELGCDEALRRDVLLDPVDHGYEHVDVFPKISKTLCVPHSMWTPAIRGANHNGRRTAVPLGSSS
jgi:hypothetical protein